MPFKAGTNYGKWFWHAFIVLLIGGMLLLSYLRALDRFELVTLDFRYNIRLLFPQKVNPDIVLIEIGEDTLSFLGKWPLPRDYHASLVDVLSKFRARAVIFDILFCEPTGWDSVFVRSVKDAGSVYFPYAFRLKETPKKGVLEASSIDAPILKDLEGAAKGTGFINRVSDIDGKVRRAPLIAKFDGKEYRSMAFEAATDYLGLKPANIPVDEEGCVLLNFAGRWQDAFTHYSYLDILAAYQELSEGKTPRLDLKKLEGKVCFVGLTATGTQEIGPVPVQSEYPMLGVHANLFNMLTEGSYLKRPGRAENLLILIILSIGVVLAIIRLRPYTAFFISLGIIALLFMSAVALFAFKEIWIDVAYPSIALFAIYLGVTLARYIGEIKAREKLQKELAVASSIQKCFLPAEIPSVAGFDIAAAMKTAREVGGDLYDFVKLDDNRLGVMIGDVSGKGIPAALFMARVESLFRVYAKGEGRPSGMIEKLNGEIASDERSGLFTTLAYAIFDAKNNTMLLSDAGHLPVILLHDNKIEQLALEDGMAVGIMEGTVFSDKAVKLSKGDIAVFYTDGASEARDLKGNEFGVERLTGLVGRFRDLPAKGIVDFIFDGLKAFQGKAVQHDDITVVVVKFYPAPSYC